MKTLTKIQKAMIFSLFAIMALSFRVQAQGCQAGFTFTVNTNTVTFTNTSTGGTQPVYVWNFGDGTYDWQTNAVHTYTFNGTFSACLTMYDSLNSGCQSSYCDTIIISGAPNPPCNANFVYYPDSMNQNQGQFYDLSANNPVSWSWTFGDGGTSTQQHPVHQYATPGYYAVCLTITDGFNQTCTKCDTVAFFPCNISAGFTWNNTNDPQIAFTNTSTGGFGPFYSWDFGDGSHSNQTNPTYTYQYNGTYMVCLTAYDSVNNCSDTYCDTITIGNGAIPPCVAQFYAYPDSNNVPSGTFYFYDYSTGGATSWSWTFGDGGTSTQQHPTHQYAQQGTYLVCLTVTTPSSTCTTCDTVQYKVLGVEEMNVVSHMQSYPNPFYQSTLINYTLDKNSNVQISVYDRIGSKVAELENSIKNAGQHLLEWNAAGLPAGIYHLELKAGNNSVSKKLVLVR